MTKQNPNVIMRPAIADTIRAIKPGDSVTFTCTEFTSYPSACGRVSQLNAEAGRPVFSIKTTDNGASYTITRAAQS